MSHHLINVVLIPMQPENPSSPTSIQA